MIYILIPCHNNKKQVLQILGCLQLQSCRDFSIVLIDDGSTDGTRESVRLKHPTVEILQGDGNLWWTGANDLGVTYILQKASSYDFILLLNNDLDISPDYLQRLVEASSINPRALIGSTLVDAGDHSFIEGGIRLDRRLNLFPNHDRQIIEETEYDMDVDVLPGRGTLIPVEVFRTVGNFNAKRLPHYGSDYELTMRAKRAGFPLVVSHRAKVYADLGITGVESPKRGIISTRKCLELLFSRKSKTNLIYYLNYVWLCSKGSFRVTNCLFAFRGIVESTFFRTSLGRWVKGITYLPGVLLHILSRILRKLVSFLFVGYPLRSVDITEYGFSVDELVSKGIIDPVSYKGSIYYNMSSDMSCQSGSVPEQQARLNQLKKHSFAYWHKLKIDSEKLRSLISGRAN